MPAIPMKEAALRYSPEIAEAFHPTLTERPATKKSWAVFDLRAAQKPIQIVPPTIRRLNVRMYGSMCNGDNCEAVTPVILEAALARLRASIPLKQARQPPLPPGRWIV